MTASQPWSVKGIDPKAREAAKDLARRSGMTLGEWLNQVILEDGTEDQPPAPPVFERSPAPERSHVLERRPTPVAPAYRRAELPTHSRDEILRVSEALDALTSRIEAAENRTAHIIDGVDQTVSSLVARLDGAERETTIAAARFEGVTDEVRAEQARLADHLQRLEQQSAEPGTAEALRAMEGTIAKVAGHLYETESETREALATLRDEMDGVSSRLDQAPQDNATLVETMVARIAERLDQAESRTTSAIQGLESSFGHLDSRLGATESRLNNPSSGGELERIAAKLSADVEAARAEMSERIQASADGRLDRVERALQEMTGHVQIAEKRSADALDRMGHEVLRLADSLSRKVQDVETRSANAIEQVGGDVARIADTMEARFNRADAVGAQALEKLGGEITRITERLVERIGNAERRSAQAIDDVGEQVSRVTERLQDRQERASNDLADRIRQSEERTARLLEDARSRIDQRLEETQRRMAEAEQRPARQATVEDDLEPGPFGNHGFDAPTARFAAPAFEPAVFTVPSFEAPTFVEPATAFEAEARDAEAHDAEPAVSEYSPGGGFDAAPREPDLIEPALIEPAPMNFVAARFQEPGPILFRPNPPAAEPAPFADGPSFAEASADDHAAGSEPLDAEFADDEPAFSPASFARHGFEPEPRQAERLFEPAEAFDHAQPFEEIEADTDDDLAIGEATAFDGPPLIEPAPHQFGTSFDDPASFMPAEGSAASDRATSTRELIEQARAAARAAAAAADPKSRRSARATGATGGRNLGGAALGGYKRPKSRPPSALAAALMVSGGAAILGMGAAGYILIAGHPSGVLPPRVMAALGLSSQAAHPAVAPKADTQTATADPMAAVALSPQPSDDTAADPAAPAAATPTAASSGAELYGDAVRRIEARDFTGMDGLRKAANLGYAPAEFYLAKLYETGEAGLKKDLGEARRWTERAAAAGDKKAMHNLALYYVEGSGGPKNTTIAAQWFRRAADLGLVDSQYNLGRLYEEGFGVSQNPAEAYKWYLIAAHAGDTESRASAQRLKGQLSPDAQSAAERAAGAFQAAQPQLAPTQLAQANTGGDVAGAAIAQRALSRLGYYQGPTDGSPSPALKGAIAAYQRDQGLPPTGVPDTALSQRLAVIAQ